MILVSQDRTKFTDTTGNTVSVETVFGCRSNNDEVSMIWAYTSNPNPVMLAEYSTEARAKSVLADLIHVMSTTHDNIYCFPADKK